MKEICFGNVVELKKKKEVLKKILGESNFFIPGPGCFQLVNVLTNDATNLANPAGTENSGSRVVCASHTKIIASMIF